jgi:hypothetical protein
VVRYAAAVAPNASAASDGLRALIMGFDDAWAGACTEFDARWASGCAQTEKRTCCQAVLRAGAFDPKTPHFSGALPVMESNDADLNQLYYWSALALVGLERTNLLSYPRGFVISEGASNSLDGSADMGGTGATQLVAAQSLHFFTQRLAVRFCALRPSELKVNSCGISRLLLRLWPYLTRNRRVA